MKLKHLLTEMQGRTIAWYDNEAQLDNVNNRANLMINAAVKALDDRGEDLTKENIISWLEGRYMDFTYAVRQAVEDSLDQDMDTTPYAEMTEGKKEDDKLNKRLQEVLKMVKKWKGPKKVKGRLSESASDEATIRSFLEQESRRPIQTIKFHPDAENSGVYGVRVLFAKSKHPVDLIIDVANLEDYEEGQFETWPPKQSRSPNPFY